MSGLLGFLLRHGYAVTFVSVFAEQAGLPLPAVPVLVGMGALSRSDYFSFYTVILTAVMASLAADLIWYQLGRLYGRSVLSVICRISLEPDFCVRRTEDAFVRRGLWTLVFAKFVPGLNAAAVPLAGMIHTGRLRFLVFDTAGLCLWAGAYTSAGYVFSEQVELVIGFLSQLGRSLLIVAAGALAGYIGYKYRQRRRFVENLDVMRITPDELKQKLDSKEKVFILDLRNQLDRTTDRVRIPGAFHALPEHLQRGSGNIPRDGDIVLYCT